MSQPDLLAALAALTGAGETLLPETPAGRDELALHLAGEARRAGVTWARIGAAFGVTGPRAGKYEVRRLAKAVAAGKPYQPPDAHPP